MAGKLANFIAYQSRHLEAADFTAWMKDQRAFHVAAGNSGAVRTIDRFTGLSQVERQLDKLQHDIGRKVMAPALELAGKLMAQMEKAGIAHDRTGTLRQSIGSTKTKLYQNDLVAWIGSGPRRGYARAITSQVQATGAVKLKRQSKKFTVTHPNFRKADPVKYARILISGRKAEVAGESARGPTGRKALMDSFTGKFFGHSVKAAPPKDFMAPAMAQADQVANIATDEINRGLQTLLPGDQQ